MTRPDDIPGLDQRVMISQIITGALVTGVVLFGIVAVAAMGVLRQPSSGVLVSVVAAGFAVMMFVAHLVLPGVMVSGALRQAGSSPGIDQLCGIFQTKLIIQMALLEGAGFFNIIACVVEHNAWPLAVAGALVLTMLAQFPTRTRVAQWIESQQVSPGSAS